MRYDFDERIDRTGSNCEKYDNLKEVFGRDDIIPLWVADTDFRTPDFIMNAIRERAGHPVLGYSFRCDYYNESIRSWLWRRNGWAVDNEWLQFCPGVICGVYYGISSLTSEGDGILIQPPVYPPFARVIEACGRRVVTNPLRLNDDGWSVDFDDLARKLPQVKALVLCNPHNPTGKVFTRTELETIGRMCLEHGVAIISDEIHSDLIMSGHRHTHIASLSADLAANTYTFISPSKTFNTAGLSTAVAVIPSARHRQSYTACAERIHVSQGNIFGAVALRAAYNNGDEWLDRLRVYIEDNIDYVLGRLASTMPEIKCVKPQGTYLMWLDCRGMGFTHDELVDFFVNKARLGLNSGLDYGQEGRLFMRLNVGCPRQTLVEALDRLQEAMARR